jgi:hypothetical protein
MASRTPFWGLETNAACQWPDMTSARRVYHPILALEPDLPQASSPYSVCIPTYTHAHTLRNDAVIATLWNTPLLAFSLGQLHGLSQNGAIVREMKWKWLSKSELNKNKSRFTILDDKSLGLFTEKLGVRRGVRSEFYCLHALISEFLENARLSHSIRSEYEWAHEC